MALPRTLTSELIIADISDIVCKKYIKLQLET